MGQKINHAYLFAGPRGVGKTTVARILAKTINCQNLSKDGKSCGKCLICQSYSKGENMDLIEIDAASNRGIDNIRELIEKIKFAPTQSQYKVFIIDEAHMLTPESWNALLKTLEEPPSHAVFVLVTTEAHKIPATIHSRCQRLDFHRINTTDMLNRLRKIAEGEKIQIQDEALIEIIHNSGGALRDAISLLDQIYTFVGKNIKKEDVANLLGITDQKTIQEFLENINQNEQQKIFLQIEEILEQGADLELFIDEIIRFIRIGIRIKLELDKQLYEEYGKEHIQTLAKFFEQYSIAKLLKILHTFIEARRKMKNNDILELPLELAVLELADFSESESAKLNMQPAEQKDTQNQIAKSPKPNLVASVLPVTVKITQVQDEWLDILEAMKKYNHSLFSLVKSMLPLGIQDNQLILGTDFKFHKERLMQTRNREIVCQVLQEHYQVPLGIQVKIFTPADAKQKKAISDRIYQKQNHYEQKFLEDVETVFESE